MTPTILVIFGITGDLSKRYLLPALYHLCKDQLLPEQFVILGTSRQQLALDNFLGQVELCVLEQDNVCDPAVLKELRSRMRLIQLDPTKAYDYSRLLGTLGSLEEEFGLCMNRLYYLSIPPQLYEPVVRNLGEQGLNTTCAHGKALTRLVVEKPFGYDLVSAQELVEQTARHFTEQQMFRIDHYLAKETVQDILLFRQRNPSYEEQLNDTNVDTIEVVAYESLGIEGRSFYDQIGALRDLIQSHLLQLLALVTMELPQTLTSQTIHAAKETLLASIGRFPANLVFENTIRGQYEGYRREVANPDSTTETFAALQLQLPIKRWRKTRVRLATGKALEAKQTAITVTFNDKTSICFRVQPQPAIEVSTRQVIHTDFSDVERPVRHANANAYERVLIDAIRGDQTLFASSREVIACWQILQPVLDEWAKGRPPLVTYPAGINTGKLLNFQ